MVIYEKKSDQKNSVEIGKSLKCKKKTWMAYEVILLSSWFARVCPDGEKCGVPKLGFR